MTEVRWQRRGLIQVPVVEPGPDVQRCMVCGVPAIGGVCRPCRDSARVRVHGSHAGFAQHKRRNELPCQECSVAEKVYQGKRYRRGSLSKRDFEWAEKAAVRGSWLLDSKLNRH